MTNVPIFARCFGSFTLSIDGRTYTDIATDRGRALLAYLLIEPSQAHRREHLTHLLWPDRPSKNGRQNFRKTLSRLRKALTPHRETLISDYKTLRLNNDLITSDVARLAHMLPQIEQTPDNLELLTQAAELYQGEFLQGFYLNDNPVFEEWLLMERELWHQKALHVLNTLITHCEQNKKHKDTIRYARQLLQLERWHERTHRRLMAALAADGRRKEALTHYEAYVSQLSQEVNVPPESETEQLYLRLQTPQAPTAETVYLGFPTVLTTFVGRTAELAQIQQRLADEQVRLLTIIGSGGMGKTRLAIHAAHHLPSDAFTHIAFVSLVGIQTAEQIWPAVADRLDTAEQAETIAHLQNTRTLLLLDNFEHLADKATAPLMRLLDAGAHILVTSRHALNLSGEWRLHLGGLDNAIDLFTTRAQRYTSRPFTAKDHAHLQHITELVGGMPLAIEMAAAWLRAYDLPTLSQFLQENLDFWVAPHADLPPRHQSMSAVFNGSWQLLSPVQQTLFARLTVFPGGFTMQAAQKVMGASVLDLARLTDRSLLRVDRHGRYHIHELLRQLAMQRIPPDDDLRRKTAVYYLRLLTDQQQALNSPRPRAAINRLRREQANLRRAWQTIIDHGDWEQVAAAADTLKIFYKLAGLYAEGRSLLAYAVEADPPDLDLRIHLRLLQVEFLNTLSHSRDVLPITDRILTLTTNPAHIITSHIAAARAYMQLARHPEAWAELAVAQEKLTAHPNPALQLRWLLQAGRGGILNQRFDETDRYCMQLWDLAPTPRLKIFAVTNLGISAMHTGRYDLARQHYQHAGRLIEQVGLGGMYLVNTLNGALDIHLGAPEKAIEPLKAGVRAMRAATAKWNEIITRYTLSVAQFQMEQYDESLKQARICTRMAQARGEPHLEAFGLLAQGRVYQSHGDYTAAAQVFEQSLQHRLRLKQMNFVAGARARLAHLHYQHGRVDAARMQIETLIDELLTSHPHAALEPFYPYWVALCLLPPDEDLRRKQLQQTAVERLLARADRLDEATREQYLAMPPHAALLAQGETAV